MSSDYANVNPPTPSPAPLTSRSSSGRDRLPLCNRIGRVIGLASPMLARIVGLLATLLFSLMELECEWETVGDDGSEAGTGTGRGRGM